MSAPTPHAQPAATIALIGVAPACEEALRAAFKLFSIKTQTLNGDVRKALAARRFGGCVIRLDASAVRLLEGLRSSQANRHFPILGVCPAGTEIRAFSRLGLNAIFHEPVVEAEAIKVVRST